MKFQLSFNLSRKDETRRLGLVAAIDRLDLLQTQPTWSHHMTNAWNHPDLIAAEALTHLEDSLVIGALCARDVTGQYTNQEMQIGDTYRIRTNPDFEAKEFTGTGPTTKQAIRDSTRPFKIEKILDVTVQITAKEKALDIDSFSEQVARPAIYRLAEKCDRYIGTKILEAAGQYASSSLFETPGDIALARKAATLQQLQPGGRFCLVNTDLEAALLGQDFFYQANIRGNDNALALREGFMARTLGMDFFSSINFPELDATAGTCTSQTNNGAGANNLIGMSTLTVDATSGTAKVGDRIRIAGVRRPLIVKTQANATATSIDLVDPITEIIPDNAAVSIIGSGESLSLKGAIFDSRSIGLAMPPLGKPSDKPSSVVSSNGYSIRIVQGYDMDTKQETMSMDLMIGAGAIDPRRITLLSGY